MSDATNYSFGPRRHPDYEFCETPLGVPCSWCSEAIEKDDNGFMIPSSEGWAVMHRECHLRAIIGSVAHLQRRCSCHVPGADETDPPELTRRQAARLAVELWEQSNA